VRSTIARKANRFYLQVRSPSGKARGRLQVIRDIHSTTCIDGAYEFELAVLVGAEYPLRATMQLLLRNHMEPRIPFIDDNKFHYSFCGFQKNRNNKLELGSSSTKRHQGSGFGCPHMLVKRNEILQSHSCHLCSTIRPKGFVFWRIKSQDTRQLEGLRAARTNAQST
jgi:hypothetical protein